MLAMNTPVGSDEVKAWSVLHQHGQFGGDFWNDLLTVDCRSCHRYMADMMKLRTLHPRQKVTLVIVDENRQRHDDIVVYFGGEKTANECHKVPSSGNIAKPRIMSKAKQVNKYKHRDVWQRKCSFSHGFSPNVRFCYVSSRTLVFLVFCRGWGAVRGGFELFRWAQSKRSGAWVRLNRWNISKQKVISNQRIWCHLASR